MGILGGWALAATLAFTVVTPHTSYAQEPESVPEPTLTDCQSVSPWGDEDITLSESRCYIIAGENSTVVANKSLIVDAAGQSVDLVLDAVSVSSDDELNIIDLKAGTLNIFLRGESTISASRHSVAPIHVSADTRLTISALANDPSGYLEVHAVKAGAAIGSNGGTAVHNSGEISIYSGKINAYAENGAAIGGGGGRGYRPGGNGTVNIFGGEVYARSSTGAAIGGGRGGGKADYAGQGGSGKILIAGGKVDAYSALGAAIGGGQGGPTGYPGPTWGNAGAAGASGNGGDGDITITGGQISAQSQHSPALGGGTGGWVYGDSPIGSGGSGGSARIVISHAEVKASSNFGPALGGGDGADNIGYSGGSGGHAYIYIDHSDVRANSERGAALGGGNGKAPYNEYYYGGDGGNLELTVNSSVLAAVSQGNYALRGGTHPGWGNRSTAPGKQDIHLNDSWIFLRGNTTTPIWNFNPNSCSITDDLTEIADSAQTHLTGGDTDTGDNDISGIVVQGDNPSYVCGRPTISLPLTWPLKINGGNYFPTLPNLFAPNVAWNDPATIRLELGTVVQRPRDASGPTFRCLDEGANLRDLESGSEEDDPGNTVTSACQLPLHMSVSPGDNPDRAVSQPSNTEVNLNALITGLASGYRVPSLTFIASSGTIVDPVCYTSWHEESFPDGSYVCKLGFRPGGNRDIRISATIPQDDPMWSSYSTENLSAEYTLPAPPAPPAPVEPELPAAPAQPASSPSRPAPAPAPAPAQAPAPRSLTPSFPSSQTAPQSTDLRDADGLPAQRLAGEDRTGTALAIFDSLPNHEHVILVSGTQYADGLSAGVLAARTASAILPANDRVLAALQAAGTRRVTLVGGTAAVSETFARSLSEAGMSVQRLAGRDRYETSAEVTKYLLSRSGPAPTSALVVTGSNFPDALAANLAAAATSAVVVLADPAHSAALEALPKSARQVCVGGAGCQAATGAATQIAGANRYETAFQLAQWQHKQGSAAKSKRQDLLVVSGENWPDSIWASSLAGPGRYLWLRNPHEKLRVPTWTQELTFLGGKSANP